MKFLVCSIATILLYTSCAAQGPQAQLLADKPSLEVESQLVKFEKQTQSALTVVINAPTDEVTKGWKAFLSEKYQLEVKKMKGGVMAEQASMADISTDKLDVYSLIKEDEKGTRLDLLVNKNGTYLSQNDHPSEIAALRAMLKRFGKDIYVGHYEEEIDEERKAASKLQKDYDKSVSEGEKLAKEGQGLVDDIAKAEGGMNSIDEKIAELQAKKEDLKADIKSNRSKIETNKSAKAQNEKDKSAKKSVLDKQNSLIERLKGHAEGFK